MNSRRKLQVYFNSTCVYVFTFLLLLSLVSCSKDEGPKVKKEVVRPAKIITVGKGEHGIRTFPAEVKASDRSELAFRVNGVLKKFPVKAGDVVKRAQLLAQIDQADYKLRLEDRKAKYDLAKVQYERADKLAKERLIPIADYDRAKSTFLASQADYKLAQQDMDYTSLRAPFDGRISRVLVKNFENVQAKQPIMVIQTEDAIDLELYVPESIMARVRERPTDKRKGVDVKFDQYPDQVYRAFVKEFDTEVDPKTQAYRVLMTMKKPEGLRLLPGMTATVLADMSAIMADSEKHVLLPVEAVFAAEDQPLNSEDRFVWKYDPATQQVSRTVVRVGEITTNGIIITSGLSKGDQVIAAGVHFLKESQKVRPMVRERGL